MELEKSYIASQRQQRGWSQQQLAEVCSLSLRTIQRIENTGQCSADSAQALAAAFDVSISQLLTATKKARTRPALWSTYALGLLLLLSSTFYLSRAMADSVMLSVSVIEGTAAPVSVRLLSREGEVAELIMDSGLRLTFESHIVPEQQVRIAVSIYDKTDERYRLTASPTLITDWWATAQVEISDDHGQRLSLQLTPEN